MGMGIGVNSALPGVIASGVVVSTGVPSVSLLAPFGCSTPVRISAGLVSVVLTAKPSNIAGLINPNATNVYVKAWSLVGSGLLTASATAYNATTGVLQMLIVTGTTGAATDGAVGFEVVENPL